jgi:dipeptidyl aminopeptidase/acylaminoacyl peptidase
MYTPADMDATKKYPILSNVYPGPQDDQIPQAYTYDDNGNQTLANLGFVVITVADRGSSPYRGHDFYCFSYGNLRDYPLADDKTAIEQLAAKYSFIDLDRVGIFGHSGGGFQTVTAMLTYPDFYKVGVAASGNYDNNIYIQWWGETFHGLGAKIPTTMELAGNLKGKLMLITGDVDNNVPCSNTLRMAQALIEKNKRFDMFVLPGKDHGVQCPYYQSLLRYYFVENLIKPSHRDIDIIKHQ